MTNRVGGSSSRALGAEVGQAAAKRVAMGFSHRDGTIEMTARGTICRPAVAAGLRRLADEVEQA